MPWKTYATYQELVMAEFGGSTTPRLRHGTTIEFRSRSVRIQVPRKISWHRRIMEDETESRP